VGCEVARGAPVGRERGDLYLQACSGSQTIPGFRGVQQVLALLPNSVVAKAAL